MTIKVNYDIITLLTDVFASQRNSLVIAAEKAVDELNSIQSNASFIANWFDAYSKGTDLLSYGKLSTWISS